MERCIQRPGIRTYVNWIWGLNAMECEIEYDQENNCARILTFHKFEQKFFFDKD
jgi:hypothetical protein